MSTPPAPKLTARDLEIAGLVWRCFKSEPQVDYAKLALLAGFKNPGTASACWGPIKKRLMGATHTTSAKSRTTAGTSSPATTGTNRRAKASKAAAPAHDDDDDDENAAAGAEDGGVTTGGKRKRATAAGAKAENGGAKKSKKTVKSEPVGDEGEDELEGLEFGFGIPDAPEGMFARAESDKVEA